MRLWSLDPSYLDAKGLVAVWREGLLARKVLEGKTKGYTNHPQLDRFKKTKSPLQSIDVYLEAITKEATRRGYIFDATKITVGEKVPKIPVTDKQLAYEFNHLVTKLKTRDPQWLQTLSKEPKAHPLFTVVEGEIEEWEKQP